MNTYKKVGGGEVLLLPNSHRGALGTGGIRSRRAAGSDQRQDALVCYGYAVARGVLDQVHGFIRQVQQLRLRFRVGRIGGDTRARGQAHIEALGAKPVHFADQLVQTPRHAAGAFLRCLRQENYELISSVAEREVDQAAIDSQHVADLREASGG